MTTIFKLKSNDTEFRQYAEGIAARNEFKIIYPTTEALSVSFDDDRDAIWFKQHLTAKIRPTLPSGEKAISTISLERVPG